MAQNAEHQQYDIGVKAVIIHDDKLLLLRRADHSSWDVPGGRICVGETPETTLYREIPEELPGARVIGIQRLLHAEQPDFTLPNGNSLMLLFYAVDVQMPDCIVTSEEHVEHVFATKKSFERLAAASPIMLAAKRALQIQQFIG